MHSISTRKERRAKARAARAVLRDRRRQNRRHSLASHAISAGESPETAKRVAGSLRTVAKRIGMVGKAGRTRRTVDGRDRLRKVTRYTTAQFRTALAVYTPRKTELAAARERLLAVSA